MPLILVASCIKPYEPEIVTGDVNKLVISGLVSDRSGDQTVSISMASSIGKPKEIPISGCTVTIKDIEGHTYPMIDSSGGNYHVWIDPKFIIPGNSFKLEVITPDGDEIVSDYDQISAGSAVDSVYYIREDHTTTDPTKFIKGIQFYVNLDAKPTDSRFFRWEVYETYEYHSDYPLEWYYNGKIHHVFPPDYSRKICWLTLQVRNIFALSTKDFAENKFNQFQLNFVNNRTSRLIYGYSLLVNQYSLSEAAYKYWDQLKINSTDEGGLYERQPLATRGNLHNLTHPDQDVLGYFGASSVSSKRIFVQNVENLELEFLSPCVIQSLPPGGLRDLIPAQYPVYLVGDQKGWQPFMMSNNCVDCLSMFGTNVKPDFWPW
jgi:hypothetical protein